MSWFKKQPRGLVYIEATGGGLLNKGKEYKGYYEVRIEEETKDMYRISFLDEMFRRELPNWIPKKNVKLI